MNAVEDAEPFDQEPDVQAALDAQPCRPTRIAKPRYKPGTRQVPPVTATATPEGSWWTRPDANFEQEAQRMRATSKRQKVPGEENVIGMNRTVFR